MVVVKKNENGESAGGVFEHYNRGLNIVIEKAQKNDFLRHFFMIFLPHNNKMGVSPYFRLTGTVCTSTSNAEHS
jgi:hypothetical protein